MAQAEKQKGSSPVLPGGTITLLLTDIEGSTSLWERAPSEMADAVRRHHEILHAAIERFRGHRPEDQGEGDSIFAAFTTATDAVSAILHAQTEISAEAWPTPSPIRVRAALHTGEVELRDGRNYFGPSVNKTARLRSVAHGGQVLVSQVTRDLTRDHLPSGADYIDLGPHRLKDLSVAEHIYQLSHPALPGEFPPINSLDSVANNLPIQLTTMIGRASEAEHLRNLIDRSKLITLTGAAGCGKTRLALQVAAENLDSFADGVWFVDLAPISDPDLVDQAAADSLGLKRSASDLEAGRQVSSGDAPDEQERLVDFISGKTMLVIFDNCEHVIDSSARLSDRLLRSCPNLKIMATSREPLGVPGEATYRVPSLPSPDPEHLPPPEEAVTFEAIQLFVERAALVRGEFALTPENTKAVAQICRRLDGIPLAIELAAARVSALSPQQISERLDDQFRLLTGGSRTSLERQQTLRAAVDWSYKLLSERERALLRRLSIFHGGFTIEAAEKVASGDGLTEADVLDLLTQLVSKSLVQRETGEGDGRYRLLETIRQFSREKLLEADEVQPTGRRHRDYFLELAERGGAELEGPNVGLWMEILEAEVDNLRAAITWSAAETDQSPVFQFGWALNEFWMVRGYSREGIQLLQNALRKLTAPSAIRNKALAAAAQLAMDLGWVRIARTLADELLEHSENLGDNWGLGRAHLTRGILGVPEAELVRADQELVEAEKLALAANDAHAYTLVPAFRAEVAIARGDPEDQESLLNVALARARAAGQRLLLGVILGYVTDSAMRKGDWDKFKEAAEEGLSVSTESGNKMLAAMYSAALSEKVGSDDPQWAAAVAAARDFNDPNWLHLLGWIALRRDAYEETKKLWGEALSVARERQSDQFPRMLNQVGWAIFLAGDLAEARTYLEECIPLARKAPVRLLLAYALHSYGEILRVSGELEDAAVVLEESRQMAQDLGQKEGLQYALISLGDIKRELGGVDAAADLYLEAGRLMVETNSFHEIAPVLERLAGVAAERASAEAGIKMMAAAAAIREAHHLTLEPVYRDPVERDLRVLRAAAGDSADSLWAEGASLTPEEAFELGRQTRTA